MDNLLSKGIITATGAAGPNVALAKQYQATDTTTYSNAPAHAAAYATLPQMNTNSAPKAAPYTTVAAAQAAEPALETASYTLLTEGGTGIAEDKPDTRFAASLANAPVDMHTPIGGHAYAGSPPHRFFQMWQQLDCSMTAATATNPSGCQNDLFPWVGVTIGGGSNGKAQSATFTDQWTYVGGDSMQFLDMAQGDVPYFKTLATTYSISDNMHQSVMGGTGANHIELGFGGPIYYAVRQRCARRAAVEPDREPEPDGGHE